MVSVDDLVVRSLNGLKHRKHAVYLLISSLSLRQLIILVSYLGLVFRRCAYAVLQTHRQVAKLINVKHFLTVRKQHY